MSDADCTPGREPRSVAASPFKNVLQNVYLTDWSYKQIYTMFDVMRL